DRKRFRLWRTRSERRCGGVIRRNGGIGEHPIFGLAHAPRRTATRCECTPAATLVLSFQPGALCYRRPFACNRDGRFAPRGTATVGGVRVRSGQPNGFSILVRDLAF